MGLLELFGKVARTLTGITPISGRKRSRDEAELPGAEGRPEALVGGGIFDPGQARQEDAKQAMATGDLACADLAAAHAPSPSPAASSNTEFFMAERVRELAPADAAGRPVVASVQLYESAYVGRGASASLAQRVTQPLAGPAAPANGHASTSQGGATPYRAQNAVLPSGTGNFYQAVSGTPSGAPAATPHEPQSLGPRQLSFTPGAATRQFGKLHLGSAGRPPAAPSPAPSALLGQAPAVPGTRTGLGGGQALGPRFGAPPTGLRGASPGWAAGGNPPAATPGWQAPAPLAARNPSGAPPLRFPTMWRDMGQELVGGRFGVAAPGLTAEGLLAATRQMEAAPRPLRPAGGPRVEYGGYLGAEEDEGLAASYKQNQVATSAAKALSAQLRERVEAARRRAGPDGAVVQAAAGGAAARASLAVSQAAGVGAVVDALDKKMSAHAAATARIRHDGEEATRRDVAALKAQDEAAKARRAPPPAPSGFAAGPSGSRPAAPAPGPGRPPAGQPAAAAPAARGRAPARPPPAPADNDVMDLISSDEEEEEEGPAEEGEEEQEEEVEEGDVDVGEDEQYGGMEAAVLRAATPAERTDWVRVFDPDLPLAEVLLAFAPNPATDIKLTREKLQCMASGTWLNDEAINLYMLLLQERDARLRRLKAPTAPRCHFFNSFFWNKLYRDEGRYNYANVRRWTLPARLRNNLQESPLVLELDRIILPVHKGVHWTCAEVDLRAKAVRYYDSLKSDDRVLADALISWVVDEAKDKLKQDWNRAEWRVEFPKAIPTQRNGCDCGVFAIMFADRLGAGVPFDFDQPDMEALRVRVLSRLLRLRVDV
ncbi:hypothetical protein HYH03_015755 [Edaphochlamys debaryana]|uniref:Ubiquitin-like protease family profile domain-containing protein n=1 Tax=Edaphochlamys debaryana TaxID=47281 RepID=A0A835XR59_9CHLO|nr:hypothetical protein HYH03_015755 [Edaphochlamys debaryana]|eukprot:KAG2485480.1 hypothetical protein HYH03_015755 [Edaphochlamys debaryana]